MIDGKPHIDNRKSTIDNKKALQLPERLFLVFGVSYL